MEYNFVPNHLNIDITQLTLHYLSIHAHLMTSQSCHQVLGEIIVFDNSLFFEKMEAPIKFKLCKQHKHDNIQKLMIAFEDNCFLFLSYRLFYEKKKKVNFYLFYCNLVVDDDIRR